MYRKHTPVLLLPSEGIACSAVMKHIMSFAGEGAGEVENVVQSQLEGMERAVKPKVAAVSPDQLQQPQGEPVHVAADVVGPKEPAAKEAHLPHNALESVEDGGAEVLKKELELKNQAGHDEALPAEVDARGVPLGQQGPEPPKINPDPLAEKEERLRQKLAQLEAEKERIEKEKLDKERIEKEVHARVEKERKERERREELAREQELEHVRQQKELLEKERLEAERLKQEQEKMDKEIMERVEKEKRLLEHMERLDQLQQAIDARRERQEKEQRDKGSLEDESLKREREKTDKEIMERAEKEKRILEQKERLDQLQQVIDAKKEQAELMPKQKGGRDLKENIEEKRSREDGGVDLKRRRRSVDPEGGGGAGLDLLRDVGGLDLNADLNGHLLAGSLVHTRQLKQTFQRQENED